MSAQDTVLVVGAGPAGLSAAATIASMGKKAVIVEKEDILGGAPIISGYAKLVPSGEWAKDAIGRMVSRVEGDGNISIHKSAKVTQVEGEAGNFTATLSNGDKVEAGAIILGTGFTHFDSIDKPEWGFGTYEDVLTTTQMEQMVTAGQIRCPSDGRVPERVAILLCVGSRDRQIGREWCSKICCTVSTNLAMEIKEISPSTDVFIYYMDIRTFGLYEDKFYWKSQEEFKTKFVKARIAEVTKSPDGRLLVKGEDTLVKRPIVIPMDIVVHAIGMDPNALNPEIARTFGIGLEKHGFIDRAEQYTNSQGTTRKGIYVCGAATGPEDIDSSVAQGQSAGARAVADLYGQQKIAS
ncbi:CoB--CoM heterodisulfide reductase iron-sulfur subunit A family protein [Acidithiobacillus ferrooxidans]|uniref:CoB--CoM heterodisulfide reductase iron-sulfur subunit A family protein n=1 Tax=Acidithiobacillus ferrooxidans TaxID=920 RepID=A0A2W1KMS7_ACIFR|nr:FAD-dependent oxidoreductase [Acidithiobacillus ferrooxidans]MCR1342515.1 FAD-dependent oxidoreductase [Acidithiobacillus ferrooxidans]PZD80597.1 CoB--CoM heterodisulfide reductase iron-sulfur subunit A family protein [Acidithiobacillus ferrooxidans]QLK42904.1 CoB--CoM heterodisulfide reductase iron-sulfur subunit A family protein [Acidithiobacillus ferrooxidans]QZT52006.1 FAD-dependent oxidoreductase [Acidithiobacillus ferrooxidans]RRN82170.1 MAG: CoB--CoM heterodisulfide reductase iron-su